jgi:hypothetical protein
MPCAIRGPGARSHLRVGEGQGQILRCREGVVIESIAQGSRSVTSRNQTSEGGKLIQLQV